MFGGKHFTVGDIKDLSGKVILITGEANFSPPIKGNTGLGKESIIQLAKHNPTHIFLAARNPAKAEEAIQDIKVSVPDAVVTFLKLDLSSLNSVAEAAKEFNAQSGRLDILMNNAGIMGVPSGTTQEGFEIQFGTNHLGHALLTKLLLPKLITTSKEHGGDVRIINLSSEGHRLAPAGGIVLDKSKLDGLGNWMGPWRRYGNSKLANLLHARELARRYPEVLSVALHPGAIMTDLYKSGKESSIILKYGVSFVAPLFFLSIPQGSLNQLWLATAKKEEIENGAYYTPVGNLSKGSSYAQDDELAKRLWDWTEKELTERGY
ncbi:MAG: hypothetical protein MMC33_010101 [Icmadophila ericetorum]|nr:hypothetical protein [Icmadophila ericetorum]